MTVNLQLIDPYLDAESFDSMHDAFLAVATERIDDTRRGRLLKRRLESNRPMARLMTRRAYRDYLQAEGSEPGNVQGFLEWLIANWESILKMIMSIVGLFGGMATPVAGGSGESGDMIEPVNINRALAGERGLIDLDAFGESVARKLLDLIRIAERHGEAAQAAVEAYINKAWPRNAPEELHRALQVARAAA